MFRRRQLIPLMGLLTLLSATEPAHAQRGGAGAAAGVLAAAAWHDQQAAAWRDQGAAA